MKLEIEIDDALFSNAATQLVAAQFALQRFGESFGTELLKTHVHAYLRQMDFTPYIQAAAKAQLEPVVSQVVEQALRDAAKKKAKQMQADGSLFA